jgi:hypothetical protein
MRGNTLPYLSVVFDTVVEHGQGTLAEVLILHLRLVGVAVF